jgi:hypothetical protein
VPKLIVDHGEQKGVASVQMTKESCILPNDQTIGSIRHDESDFLMCGIGSDGPSFLYNKGKVVSEPLVSFGQARDGHLFFV